MVPNFIISCSTCFPKHSCKPREGASRSFLGNLQELQKINKLSTDVCLWGSKSNATIVKYDGYGAKLAAEIVELFKKEGKIRYADCHLFKWHTPKNEKVGVGTIASIEALVVKDQLSHRPLLLLVRWSS